VHSGVPRRRYPAVLVTLRESLVKRQPHPAGGCIRGWASFNQPRAIDRAIIGGGVLIGTISFIAAIPGASFGRGGPYATLEEKLEEG